MRVVVWLSLAGIVCIAATTCAPDAVLAPETVGGGGQGGAAGAAGMDAPACDAAGTDFPPGQCDLYLQNCPPPQRCAVAFELGEYSLVCTDPNGGKGIGEPCVAGECEWGLSCFWGTCTGACCRADHDPCGDEARCNLILTLGTYTIEVCSFVDECQLFAPDPCAAATPTGFCHFVDVYGDARCMPTDGPPPKAEGETCAVANQCGDSLGCRTGRCRYYCYLEGWESLAPAEGGCPSAQTCLEVVAEYTAAGLGLCRP